MTEKKTEEKVETPKEETLQSMLGKQVINSPKFKGKVIIKEK